MLVQSSDFISLSFIFMQMLCTVAFFWPRREAPPFCNSRTVLFPCAWRPVIFSQEYTGCFVDCACADPSIFASTRTYILISFCTCRTSHILVLMYSYPFEHIALMQLLLPIHMNSYPSICAKYMQLFSVTFLHTSIPTIYLKFIYLHVAFVSNLHSPHLMKFEQNQNSPKQVAFNNYQNYVIFNPRLLLVFFFYISLFCFCCTVRH
jgi:hypothetical protein